MKDSNQKIGSQGEEIAAAYLTNLDYEILEQNATCKIGEIDLIAKKQDRLHFIEIKRRIGDRYGKAMDAVDIKKMRKIRRVAQYFLMQNPEWEQLIPFFSVIAIDENESGQHIEFLEDAFS